jgi:hypothetical protein
MNVENKKKHLMLKNNALSFYIPDTHTHTHTHVYMRITSLSLHEQVTAVSLVQQALPARDIKFANMDNLIVFKIPKDPFKIVTKATHTFCHVFKITKKSLEQTKKKHFASLSSFATFSTAMTLTLIMQPTFFFRYVLLI